MSKKFIENFNLRIKKPLDNRVSVELLSDIDRPYEGLFCYQQSDEKYYKYTNGEFTEFTLDIPSVQANILAIKRKLDNLEIVNVKDYGAKGDGLTDDTASIQSAIDYASSLRVGGIQSQELATVVFPVGDYIVNGNLTMTDNQQFCNLEGLGVATLYHKGTGILLSIGNSTTNGTMPMRIKNLFFKRDDQAVGTVGLKLKRTSNVYCENLASNGFETAFLLEGVINGLFDFKRNFIRNTTYGFVADTSNYTTGRFNSNLLLVQNVHFNGDNGFVLKNSDTPLGAGGLVKLSYCTFETLTGTSIKISNGGEVKGLECVEVDHCWFENYGILMSSILYSRVLFKHCFIAGIPSKCIVLEDDNAFVEFENSYGYFTDTPPASGCLIEKGTGATNVALSHYNIKNSKFTGLTGFSNTVIKEYVDLRNVEEKTATVKLGNFYPTTNLNQYNTNLVLNLLTLITDTFGAITGRYKVNLIIFGTDGINYGIVEYNIYVIDGHLSVTAVRTDASLTLSETEGTSLTLSFPTTDNGRWYNAKCKLRLITMY